jgi:hypothetical protein
LSGPSSDEEEKIIKDQTMPLKIKTKGRQMANEEKEMREYVHATDEVLAAKPEYDGMDDTPVEAEKPEKPLPNEASHVQQVMQDLINSVDHYVIAGAREHYRNSLKIVHEYLKKL